MDTAFVRRSSFFALVHLLEQYLAPLPTDSVVAEEDRRIHFSADPSFGFPIADVIRVDEIDKAHSNSAFNLVTTFFGLVGTVTPLPLFYADDVLRDQENSVLPRFLDFFHDRATYLLYRAWLKYHYEFFFQKDAKDAVSLRILALMGLNLQTLTDEEIPPALVLRYAGLFYQKPRSASNLASLLSAACPEGPVTITQCVGSWVVLADWQRPQLGRRACTLGADCVLGQRVYSASSKFRLHLPELPYSSAVRFLPRSQGFETVVSLVKLFSSDPLQFDVEVTVKPETIPDPVLSTKRSRHELRLGWTSWLGAASRGKHRLVFQNPLAGI